MKRMKVVDQWLVIMLTVGVCVWLASCTRQVYYYTDPCMFTVPTGEVEFVGGFNDGGRDSASFLNYSSELFPEDSAHLAYSLKFVPLTKDTTRQYLFVHIYYRGIAYRNDSPIVIDADSICYWLKGENEKSIFKGLMVPSVRPKWVSKSLIPDASLTLAPFPIPRDWKKPVMVAFHLKIWEKPTGRVLVDKPVEFSVIRAVNTEIYLLQGK